jgi:hypothetical protein
MGESVSVTREIAAPAEQIWAMVAELSRMGEWSPENIGGKWLGGATGPALGAKFKGTNRNGRRRWSTVATVTACEPGRAFEFTVASAGWKVARWGYQIEPGSSGCRVTESWHDQRGWMIRTMGKPVSGTDHGVEHTRSGMEATLAKLAAAAETPRP